MSNQKQTTLIETIQTPLGTVRISVKSNGINAIAVGGMPKEIENGMSIEHTQAALISITPSADSLESEIACELVGSEFKGTPSTGENLDCIEWSSENWNLTIGTEDTEALKLRYPEVEVVENLYPVEYHDSGIMIKLNAKNVLNTISMHVIVSSKRLPDERDCTAWFFADRPHKLVLKAIGSNV